MDTLVSLGIGGGLRLVAVGAVPRRRRHARDDDDVQLLAVPARQPADLPRGRRGGHHVHARRPLPRGPRQAPGRRRAARPAGAGRQGRRRAARRRRGARPGRPSSRVGDAFVVRPGEKVATDGVVERRRRRSTRSMLTGESVPVEVGPGDAVVGATVNAGGRLVVRATRVGADTQLAQMARLVEEAQNGKAPVQRLADRVSGGLRAGRARARRCSRWPAGCSPARGADGGVHRRGRRADHRLPLRARPGHADRAAGRHRPRRPARHPDQGPRGARVDPRGSTPSCSTRPAPSPPAG